MTTMNNNERDECSVSTHEFKLHDWRWLGWPLSNPFARGRWCRLCGLTDGKPEGKCQTADCLEYAAGGNDFCESCRQNRMIADAATRMRDLCVAHLQATADALDVKQETECPCGTAFNSEAALRRGIATELESLTLDHRSEK